jgi:hypothetical protein
MYHFKRKGPTIVPYQMQILGILLTEIFGSSRIHIISSVVLLIRDPRAPRLGWYRLKSHQTFQGISRSSVPWYVVKDVPLVNDYLDMHWKPSRTSDKSGKL